MTATIQTLTHYPIKGLNGHVLTEVDLRPHEGFPLDRVFGFAKPDSGFDPANPKPLSKENFHVLAGDAALALLQTSYDSQSATLRIVNGQEVIEFNLLSEEGRTSASFYLSQFLTLPPTHTPTLYAAHPHRFTDVSVTSAQMMNAVSLVSQDSVDAFERLIGAPVDSARFRANIVFSGLAAYEELDLVGQIIAIGDLQLRVLKRTQRCAATEVNLTDGTRDLKIPYLLRKHLGHMDMGIYAEVLTAGTIRPGDALSIVG